MQSRVVAVAVVIATAAVGVIVGRWREAHKKVNGPVQGRGNAWLNGYLADPERAAVVAAIRAEMAENDRVSTSAVADEYRS